MNISAIRGFLLMRPKPHTVRVTRDDGSVQSVKPKNYQKTAETIAALHPELIECLDAAGQLLRAKDVSPQSDGGTDEDVALPEVLQKDAGAATFALYAKLLARAYSHSIEVAFGKMVEVFDRVSDRSDAIEARLAQAERDAKRAEQELIDDAFERAAEAAEKAGEQGIESQLGAKMFDAFLSGQAKKAAATPAPNGKPPTNGKGQPQ